MSKPVIHTGLEVHAQNMAIGFGIAEAGAEQSHEDPGNRAWTVLTEGDRPEAFPSEGKAGCRV